MAAVLVVSAAAVLADRELAGAATPPQLTIALHDWYPASYPKRGAAVLTQRGRDVVIRIEMKGQWLLRNERHVKIYGGQSEGFRNPKTDCELVYNNAMTVLEPGTDWDEADKGLSIRRDLGVMRTLRVQKIVRGTTLAKLRRSSDALAVWSFGSVFACGDF